MEFPSQPRSTNASLVPPPSPMHQHTHLPSLPSTDLLSMTTAEREGARSGTTFSRDCAVIRDQIQLSLVLSRPRMRKQDGVRSNSIVSSHTPKLKTQENNLSSVAEIGFNTSPLSFTGAPTQLSYDVTIQIRIATDLLTCTLDPCNIAILGFGPD